MVAALLKVSASMSPIVVLAVVVALILGLAISCAVRAVD